MANYPAWGDLNAKQRKQAMERYRQRHNNTPKTDPLDRIVAPGLTLRELNQNTTAAARLKYGAEGNQLAALPARTNDWYRQYQLAIKAARANQDAANQQAVAGVSQLQQGLNTASQQQWAGEQAAMAADAANRGASTDPALAEQAHGASNVRNALTGSFGAMLLGQGQADRKGYTDRLVSSGQQRVTEQGKIASARRQLAAEKGAFKQTYRDQAISDAASTALKNALTASTLGKDAATVAKTVADTKATEVKTQKTALENAYFQKYGKYPSTGNELNALEKYRLNYAKTHGGKFPGTESSAGPDTTGKDQFGNTRKDRERSQNEWDRAKSLAHLIGGKDVGELAQLLIAKDSSVPPWMARAAAQQVVLGYVGPNLRTRLRKHGVKKGYTKPKGAQGVTGTTSA